MENLGLADESFDPSTNPLVEKISSAELPGVTYTPADLQKPELQGLVKNARTLVNKLGLAVYQNPKTRVGALFNPEVLKLEEVKAADAAGKLQQLLPGVGSLLGGAAPETAEPSSPPASSGAIQAGGPPLSKGGQTALAQGRVQALASKRSDPIYPGAGKILNSLTR